MLSTRCLHPLLPRVVGTAAMLFAVGMSMAACAGGETQLPVEAPHAVYVSPFGNDNSAGVTPTTAVASIGTGIQRALNCTPGPCEVRITGGNYDEQVMLADGVDLIGGWADDFSARDIAAHATVIRATAERGLVAEGLAQPTRVDGLTVQGADVDDAADGRSTFAVWISGSEDAVAFVDVVIDAGKAAAAAAAADGEELSCTAAGGQGGEAFNCGASQGGDGSAGGDATVGGDGGPGGSSNCPNACPLVGSDGVSGGTAGTAGGDGLAGLAGAPSDDAEGAFVDGGWQGSLGEAGARGMNGTGGGGGGAGGSKRFVACFGCSTLIGGRGGDGAVGGCGGGGGQPGGAGGGSFGMVLADARVRLEAVIINAGPGGDGGRGGDGAAGQPGGVDVTQGQQSANSQQCGALNYQTGGGGLGGSGGAGGLGGGGAGGVGGPSIAIALVTGSSFDDGGSNVFNFGPGGSGGAGGLGGADAQPGIDGAAQAVVTYTGG